MYFLNLYFAVLLASLSLVLTTAEDPMDSVTEPFDAHIRPSSMDDKTVSEIMNEQTEAIKQIISAHKPGVETPLLISKDPIAPTVSNYDEPIIKEEERPIEDVRAKCEYYFKISNSKSKEAEKREEISKPTNAPYLYASTYGNQQVYSEYQPLPKPVVQPTVQVANLGVVKEETEQNRYYQYVPNDVSNKKVNTNVGYVPYFYASNYGSQTFPVATQAENQAVYQFNSNSNADTTSSISKLGIIKEEAAQNKYYEYTPSNVQNKKSPNLNFGNIQYVYPSGYGNQPHQFPLYAENQFNTKSTVEAPPAVTKMDASVGQTLHNTRYQYIPYNFYTYPIQNLPTIQKDGVHNEHLSLSNVVHQAAQISTQHDINSEQKFSNQNQELKYVKVAPLALQNALVSDGKAVYYWYKSMPGYQIYMNVPYNVNNRPQFEEPLPEASQIYNHQGKINFAYVTHPPKPETTTPIITTTIPTTTTTTTTTETVPTYEVKYNIKDSSKDVLKHQLKFVYPLPYTDTVDKNPWQVDPYAYYPKDLRPNMMRVPYAPTFHVIKTLDIPNRYVENGKVKIGSGTKK